MHCKALGLEVPSALQTYSDLRLVAQRYVFQQGRIGTRASSLKETADAVGVEMIGSEHCGLDDAWMVLLALQQLIKSGIDLRPERRAFLEGRLTPVKEGCWRLGMDGLPFSAVGPDVTPWLEEHLGKEAVRKMKLLIDPPSESAEKRTQLRSIEM
eukprot:g23972.t1